VDTDDTITDTDDTIISIEPTNTLDWLTYTGIGTATTLCLGASLCSAISLVIIARSCKQRKNKQLLNEVDEIELKTITSDATLGYDIGKIEEELTKKAQKMANAAQNNKTSTVIELSRDLREGEIKYGSQLQNPGVIAVKLAKTFESDEFNTLSNESETKQKVFECFEKYFGLYLVISAKTGQVVVADYQEKMLKLIGSFKKTVRKNYKVKFSLDAIEQAMKNLKTTESKVKTLLTSAINIKETGTLFATLVEQYNKIPGEWYPKMIINRYTAYKGRNDIDYLSALQKILLTQNDWHILMDGVNSLVDIALNAKEDKIKSQVLLDDKKSGIRGLPFWIAYKKGSKSSIIRMEAVKGLTNIIKYSENSNLKKQACSFILERKIKEENKEIRTFIENFEKEFKDEFKREARTTTKKIKRALDKKYIKLKTKKFTLKQMKIELEENMKSIKIEEKEAEKLKERIEKSHNERDKIKEKLELTNQRHTQIENELKDLQAKKELSQSDWEKEEQFKREKDEVEKTIETLKNRMLILNELFEKYEEQLKIISRLKQKPTKKQEKINKVEESLKKELDEYAFSVKQFENVNVDYQLALKLREKVGLKNERLYEKKEEEQQKIESLTPISEQQITVEDQEKIYEEKLQEFEPKREEMFRKEGNREYNKGNYDQALSHYEKIWRKSF
jgi:hypothetical protein